MEVTRGQIQDAAEALRSDSSAFFSGVTVFEDPQDPAGWRYQPHREPGGTLPAMTTELVPGGFRAELPEPDPNPAIPYDINVYRVPEDPFKGLHLWIRDGAEQVTVTCNNYAGTNRETLAVPAGLLGPLGAMLARLNERKRAQAASG